MCAFLRAAKKTERRSQHETRNGPKIQQKRHPRATRANIRKHKQMLQKVSPEGVFLSPGAFREPLGHQVGPRRVPKVAWEAPGR